MNRRGAGVGIALRRTAWARRRVAGTRPIALLPLVLPALAGCGAHVDKAGGHSAPRARVLTLASGNGGPVGTLQVFADQVARLSHGRLRIVIHREWRKGQTEFEPGVIRDVRRGAADIGWTGTRAWDAVGVRAFDALHMPLLVDSLALEQKVLASPLPAAMLRDVSPLGLVGLGVLPGPLRKPLAVKRPLLTPADFRSLRLAGQDSRVARRSLAALGASFVPIPSGGRIVGLDGVESQIDAIRGNHYELQARYLAGNVNLWPRPLVVFMSRRRFDALPSPDRDALVGAAKAATGPMLAQQRRLDAQATADLCRRGLVVGEATPGDLAALREAVAGVYASADPTTRDRVRAIEAIKARLGAPPDVTPACRRSAAPAGVIPDGAYVVTITSRDALRGGLPKHNDLVRVRRQQFRLVLHAGSFTLYELHNSPPTVGFAGTLSVYRDRVVVRGDVGDVLDARWAVHGRQLRFSDVTLRGYPHPNNYSVVWGSHPWIRTG